MKEKIDYIKDTFANREQTRFDTTNPDDAATLLMSLMELEWRYHHVAMLKYRNHKYKEFHDFWGRYWATKTIINIIFPWYNGGEPFSRRICELNHLIDEEDSEMITLKRAPGTCCPEPTCDYKRDDPITACESCGKKCEGCKRG